MVSIALLSTALMGMLVIATFVAVARIGGQRNPPRSEEPTDRYAELTETFSEFVRTPAVWAVGFVVVTVGVGAATVLAVGDFGLPEGMSDTFMTLVFAAVGLLVTGFVFLGVYFATRGTRSGGTLTGSRRGRSPRVSSSSCSSPHSSLSA